jgi:hypothetical protein
VLPTVAVEAITLAIQAFPDKSARQIAPQVGCTPSIPVRHSRVTGKDGKTNPASRRDALSQAAEQDADVAQMLLDGASAVVIGKTLRVWPEVVARVRREIGMGVVSGSSAWGDRLGRVARARPGRGLGPSSVVED